MRSSRSVLCFKGTKLLVQDVPYHILRHFLRVLLLELLLGEVGGEWLVFCEEEGEQTIQYNKKAKNNNNGGESMKPLTLVYLFLSPPLPSSCTQTKQRRRTRSAFVCARATKTSRTREHSLPTTPFSLFLCFTLLSCIVT